MAPLVSFSTRHTPAEPAAKMTGITTITAHPARPPDRAKSESTDIQRRRKAFAAAFASVPPRSCAFLGPKTTSFDARTPGLFDYRTTMVFDGGTFSANVWRPHHLGTHRRTQPRRYEPEPPAVMACHAPTSDHGTGSQQPGRQPRVATNASSRRHQVCKHSGSASATRWVVVAVAGACVGGSSEYLLRVLVGCVCYHEVRTRR